MNGADRAQGDRLVAAPGNPDDLLAGEDALEFAAVVEGGTHVDAVSGTAERPAVCGRRDQGLIRVQAEPAARPVRRAPPGVPA